MTDPPILVLIPSICDVHLLAFKNKGAAVVILVSAASKNTGQI